ncbi:hypothetical protein D3C76_849550 [compost metagenome]
MVAIFIGYAADAVTGHAGLLAQRGKATSAQFQAFDFLGSEQGAGSDFRDQTAVVGSEYRAGNELLAVFQGGVGQTQFHCTAYLALGFFRVAVAVVGEQAVTALARAAVQLDRTHGHGVEAETNDTLSEARLVGEQLAQTGILTIAGSAGTRVACTILVVAVHVLKTGFEFQARIVDETLGFVLGRRHCELRGACCNSQCDHAPLHHAHRDLLLWF